MTELAAEPARSSGPTVLRSTPDATDTNREISPEARAILARTVQAAQDRAFDLEAEGYRAFADEHRAIAAELGPTSFSTLPAE